jgi:predicted ArsR family transcriptional regulator
MVTKYASDHIKIKKMMNQIKNETGGSSCVVVSELSKELDMDPRTLRKHLEVMEIDGCGSFSNPKKNHIFCHNKEER